MLILLRIKNFHLSYFLFSFKTNSIETKIISILFIEVHELFNFENDKVFKKY